MTRKIVKKISRKVSKRRNSKKKSKRRNTKKISRRRSRQSSRIKKRVSKRRVSKIRSRKKKNEQLHGGDFGEGLKGIFIPSAWQKKTTSQQFKQTSPADLKKAQRQAYVNTRRREWKSAAALDEATQEAIRRKAAALRTPVRANTARQVLTLKWRHM